MKPSEIKEKVNSIILKQLENGVIPRKRRWSTLQISGTTGQPYRGINQLVLQVIGTEKQFTTNRRLTFRMVNQMGGSVKKGEKGSFVVYWQLLEDKIDPDKKIPVLRVYPVFNLDQTTLKPSATQELEVVEANTAEQIVKNFADKPSIIHEKYDRAYYRLDTDEVHIPFQSDFESKDNYYATLFHELSHSTGAPERLHRFEKDTRIKFGDHFYSLEELVASTSEAYLCGQAQIEPTTIEDAGAYIKHWINAVKGDHNLFISASNKGRDASEYILGGSKHSNKYNNKVGEVHEGGV